MAGLEDLDPTNPDNSDLLSGGAGSIRTIITKLIEFAAIEHALTGEHTFGVGTIAARPAASASTPGRLYILTVAGVAAELQYDGGGSWVTITKNQVMIDYASALATHIDAETLDHPNNSVTAAKIAAGAILKKHLMGGVSTASIANLVNGGLADDLHTHTWDSQAGVTGFTEYTVPGAHVLTVPTGVVRMNFSPLGGGGGGGGGYNYSGGGGGAAGILVPFYPMTVTGGQEIDLYVGNGGFGSNEHYGEAKSGEASTVEGFQFNAPGGAGGKNGISDATYGSNLGGITVGSANGGRGGSDPTIGTAIPALAGESSPWFDGGAAPGGNRGGGGGGATNYGEGKAGGVTGVAGSSGSDGTGVGAGGAGSGAGVYGGNGGAGRIMVSW